MSRRWKKKAKPEEAAAARSNAPVAATGEMPGVADARSLKSRSYLAGLNDRWIAPGVCIFLAAVVWVIFGQTLHHEFINFDDNDYVYENPTVNGGLTLNGIATMFAHVECNFYHPLTMISLMVNYQLNGLHPGGYHLTNVLLHTLSAILLFLILRGMTGFTLRSAFVAAVFAIHPLRVESVAWVAERKDVLSGFFFMLTLWAYARYVRNTRSTNRYLVVVVLFALGLLCKPSLVTLPFALLLLDYWPLQRFGAGAVAGGKLAGQRGGFSVFARLVVEKAPLFALSAAASVMAPIAEGEAMAPLAGVPFLARMGNSIMSYVTYLRQMVCPVDLAPLYPFAARDLSGWKIILALALLVAISAAAVAAWRKRPYLLVGWLWYLGILVPMIGIMQVGGFAHADRYTYLPMIGMCFALTWAAADLCAGWRHRNAVLGGCSATVFIALIFCARAQTSYWRNSESLWTRTLACTSDNFIAHNNLGDALLEKGSVGEAIIQFQKALQIQPNLAETHYNLGNALLQKGDMDEAIAHYQRALQIKPGYAKTHYNLGNALLQRGDIDEAIAHYQQALQVKHDYAEAHNNLGYALLQKGNVDEAIAHYQQALQIRPDYAKALNNLAWALAACPQASLRNGNKAVELAQRANQLAGNGNPDFLDTLAIAYADAGRFPEAVETARRALQLAEAQSSASLADAIRSQLELYQAGKPFHLP
jgi:tetratricopeptide (TPR) repeat protein